MWATVDEGDLDAQRFYERHGYTSIEPDTGERAVFHFNELDPPIGRPRS